MGHKIKKIYIKKKKKKGLKEQLQLITYILIFWL